MKAIKENLLGKEFSQIFVENGFDLTVIGADKSQNALKRWRKSFQLYGEEEFYEERQGKGNTSRPLKNLSGEKKLTALKRQAKKRF